MTRRPGWRECTVYRRPGLRGMPLALSLSEGLGVAPRGMAGVVVKKRQR